MDFALEIDEHRSFGDIQVQIFEDFELAIWLVGIFDFNRHRFRFFFLQSNGFCLASKQSSIIFFLPNDSSQLYGVENVLNCLSSSNIGSGGGDELFGSFFRVPRHTCCSNGVLSVAISIFLRGFSTTTFLVFLPLFESSQQLLRRLHLSRWAFCFGFWTVLIKIRRFIVLNTFQLSTMTRIPIVFVFFFKDPDPDRCHGWKLITMMMSCFIYIRSETIAIYARSMSSWKKFRRARLARPMVMMINIETSFLFL